MIMVRKSALPLCQSTFNLMMKNQLKKHQHQRNKLKLKKLQQQLKKLHQQRRFQLKQLLRKRHQHQKQKKERKLNMPKLKKPETLWLTVMPIWRWPPLKLRLMPKLENKLSLLLNKSQTLNKNNSVD